MPARRKSAVSASARPIGADRQRRILLALLAIVLLVGVGSFVGRIAYERWRVVEVDTIPYQYKVIATPNIGFALGTGDLAFGKVTFGGGGSRTVRFSAQQPVTAVFVSDDPYISARPPKVALVPGEEVAVSFNLDVPLDAQVGNFTGVITVLYLRPLPWE